tara:strand:+ start:443 stop:640 length:198 start_codon:yes stop_codon:yes gene_type:complete
MKKDLKAKCTIRSWIIIAHLGIAEIMPVKIVRALVWRHDTSSRKNQGVGWVKTIVFGGSGFLCNP